MTDLQKVAKVEDAERAACQGVPKLFAGGGADLEPVAQYCIATIGRYGSIQVLAYREMGRLLATA